MMKNTPLIITLALMISSPLSQAMDWEWTRYLYPEDKSNVPYEVRPKDMIYHQGHLYITGEFFETVDFGDGIVLEAFYLADGFVMKMDAATSEVIWVSHFYSDTHDCGNALQLSPDGEELIVVGSMGSSIVNDTVTVGVDHFGNSIVAPNNGSFFVHSLNPENGTVNWHRLFAGSTDEATGVVIDNEGMIYACGNVFRAAGEQSYSFGALQKNFTAQENETVIVKLTPQGSPIWLRAADHTFGGNSFGNALAISSKDAYYPHLYLVGMYEDSVRFETMTLSTGGLGRCFLATYNTSGALKYALRFGSYKSIQGPYPYSRALAVKVDPAENVYVCGTFTGSASFGATELQAHGPIHSNPDGFLLQVDSNGYIQWAIQQGASSPTDSIDDIHLRGDGEVLITGKQKFQNNTYTFLASIEPENGALSWVKSVITPTFYADDVYNYDRCLTHHGSDIFLATNTHGMSKIGNEPFIVPHNKTAMAIAKWSTRIAPELPSKSASPAGGP